uniref:BRO1 domain-containing protein BROX n=1 Tax=Ciona savignyi TaxID=51511 RepID=H2YC40_CIOSA
MAHWFHRNPFKATAAQTFDVRKISMKSDFSKIIGDLRNARSSLLSLFNDPLASMEKMDEVSGDYFSLIQGFPKISKFKSTCKTGEIKMRLNNNIDLLIVVKFYNSNSMLLNGAWKTSNSWFDFVNMGVNVALWYSKHSAKLATKPELKMEDAKEIHSCLKKAAGIFKEFKDNHATKLSNPPEKCSDLDPNVLECYIMCCQAEAQEVTIARAVEKKHKDSLIAALSNETSKYFQQADHQLHSHDQNIVGKWRKYLQLKQKFYKAYAMCYYGSALLSEEKCGDSIRCLKESFQALTETSALCKEYIATKGAGSTIQPHQHAFYINFQKELDRKLKKSESENGFIYHHKVPPVAPNMTLQATHGLVEPTPYTVPVISSNWNKQVYSGFNITK